jgi:hypothetical protein
LGYLTGWQISEWEAYDKIDPIGSWREDFRMAFLSSLITNLVISVHGKKGAKTTSPVDFMPNWTGEEKEPKRQSTEEMKQILLGIASTQNKRVRGLDKPPVSKMRKEK